MFLIIKWAFNVRKKREKNDVRQICRISPWFGLMQEHNKHTKDLMGKNLIA